MGYTKRQFVEGAYTEIGVADFVYDVSSEELQYAARRLDAMMAEWNGRGIRLGYPLASSPEDISLSEETNVKDAAYEAIITNLAVKIAPSFGKQVSPDTKAIALMAYNTLLSISAQPDEMLYPETMPIGAGYKPWRNQDTPFVRQDDRQPEIGPDTFLDPN